jgi:hypothetical protein
VATKRRPASSSRITTGIGGMLEVRDGALVEREPDEWDGPDGVDCVIEVIIYVSRIRLASSFDPAGAKFGIG